jgi:alpha-ribazole phosphatase/probable phosphoglycerate mutase
MTILTLVRHGQTDWNLQRRYQGQKDIPLNEEGIRQAKALAARLAGESFDAIYSSDLQRASQTAKEVHKGRSIDLIMDARLREICFGAWEGELFQEMFARYPERFELSRADPSIIMAPGGESVAQVAARTSALADEISRLYPSGKVLLVTHGMALATLVCRSSGCSLTTAHNMVPENAEPVQIEWPLG